MPSTPARTAPSRPAGLAPTPGGAGRPHSPVEDGLLLLLLRAGAAQDPLPGLRVLCLPLSQGLDREGRPAGGVGATDHTVAGGPLEDADLWRGARGKAIVLNHNGHFGRRFGFPAGEEQTQPQKSCPR